MPPVIQKNGQVGPPALAVQWGGVPDTAPRIMPEDPARAGVSSGPAEGVRDGEDDLCAFNWKIFLFPQNNTPGDVSEERI